MRTFKPLQFPVQLRLEVVPRDRDPCGIWSHHEFFKHLSKICQGKPENFIIRELECVQETMALHTAVSIVEEKQCEAKVSKPKQNFDVDFFDASWIFNKQGSEGPKPNDTLKEKLPDLLDDDEDDDFRNIFSDVESDLDREFSPMSKKRKVDLEPEPQSKLPSEIDKGPLDGPAPSECGSVAHIKTIATQKDLVQKALESAGRPGGELLCVESLFEQNGNAPNFQV